MERMTRGPTRPLLAFLMLCVLRVVPMGVALGGNCEAERPAFIPNKTTSASFGCGGVIQLPSKGDSIVLDFNLPATTPGSPQRCLWAFDGTTQGTERGLFKVQLTLLSKKPNQIFDDENKLTFTEWQSLTTSKDTTTYSFNSSIETPFVLSTRYAHRGFLSFNSKTIDSEAGFSFTLRADVLERRVYPWESSSSLTKTESAGSATYSLPSSTRDFSSIVINPQPAANITLTVDFVQFNGTSNPCGHYSSVDLLEFGMNGVPKQLGRLCGDESAISYSTENPVAALFLWYASPSGRSVKLSWK